MARVGCQEAEHEVLGKIGQDPRSPVAFIFAPDPGEEEQRAAVVLGKPGPDGRFVVAGAVVRLGKACDRD
jgi:hypothetical protein